jgi:hypothetical protein
MLCLVTRVLFSMEWYALGWRVENMVRRYRGHFIVPEYHFGCPHCEGRR